MRVSAEDWSEPDFSAASLAFSRFFFRSESSVFVLLASWEAFWREDSRAEIWVWSVLVLSVWEASCLFRLEISSSRDSMVADLEATWALRSSMEEEWLGEAVEMRREVLDVWVWRCESWRFRDSTSVLCVQC
jgi:hypothetical protein